MTRTVDLGAPSLTGKDANQLVAEVFADAKYPLAVTVKNHMPRDVVFPEVPDLFLRHVAHATESQKTVTIPSADVFQRVASSIEQVAELNRYALAVTISSEEGTPAADAPADEGGAAAVGAEVVAKKPSDGLTYEQLKEALAAKGIEFPANAKKVDLAAMLDAAPTEAIGSEGIGDTGTVNG